MAAYQKQVSESGVTSYHADGEQVKKADLPEGVYDALQNVPVGTSVDENGKESTEEGEFNDDDGVDAEEQARAEAARVKAQNAPENDADTARDATIATVDATTTPQSDPGMGFPRKDGKTLDVFDDVPYEVVRNVAGFMVPLTRENAEKKSEVEIINKLKDLKKL